MSSNNNETVYFEIEISEGIIKDIVMNSSVQINEIKELLEVIVGTKYIIADVFNKIDNSTIDLEIKVLIKSIF